MGKLQKQAQEIKRTQQDISSQKKQFSETRGFFRGKERKSLEKKIRQAEKLVDRMYRNLEQIAKQDGYANG